MGSSFNNLLIMFVSFGFSDDLLSTKGKIFDYFLAKLSYETIIKILDR